MRGLRGGESYAREFVPAITAFRRRALFLDVQVSQFAAGGLDDADFVRAGVVGLSPALQMRSVRCPLAPPSRARIGGRVGVAYVCESVGHHRGGIGGWCGLSGWCSSRSRLV